MNRLEIKEKAKEILKENFKSFWAGYLIILAISILLNLGVNILFDEKSTMYAVLTLVITCFSMTLSVGFYSYLLKMIRNEEYNRNEIFKFVDKVFPIIVISLMTFIFCFFWSILFIIPGIIAAFSYKMVYLIYAENQSFSEKEYLDKSKEMMQGYKWNYFVFCLSFVGWILLSCLTFGILFIWTIPYIIISEVVYYDELKKIKDEN